MEMFDTVKLSASQFHGLTSEVLGVTAKRGSVVGNLLHHLVFFGTALGRYPHVYWRGEVYPALNSVLVGPTACGKGESLRMVSELYAFPEEKKYLLAPSMTASFTAGKRVAQMILSTLASGEDGECRFLSIDEECTSQIKCSAIWINTLSGIMINLFDGNEISEAISYRQTIHLPPLHYGSIGHITPLSLLQNLKPKDMTNGFANRMLFMGLSAPEYTFEEAEVDRDALDKVRLELVESLEEGGERERVEMEDAAKECFVEFARVHHRQTGVSEHLRALEVRFPQMCLKIALIIALTNREERVSRESMEEACMVMRRSRQSLEELYGGVAVEAPEHVVTTYLAQNGKTRRTDLMQALSATVDRSILEGVLVRLVRDGSVIKSVQMTARGRRPEFFELAPQKQAA